MLSPSTRGGAILLAQTRLPQELSPTPPQGSIWVTYNHFRQQLGHRTRCLSHSHCLSPHPASTRLMGMYGPHRAPVPDTFRDNEPETRRGFLALLSLSHMQVTQPQQRSTRYLQATKQFCSIGGHVLPQSTPRGTLWSRLPPAVTTVVCSL